MKVYIAGKITNNPDYIKQFAKAEEELKACTIIQDGITFTPLNYEENSFELLDVTIGIHFHCLQPFFGSVHNQQLFQILTVVRVRGGG